MIMVGVILFIAAIAVIFVIVILTQNNKGVIVTNFKNFEYDSKNQILREKDKKDGIVIDLKDFEYDSKEEVFRKREVDDKFLDEMFNSNSSPTYWGMAGSFDSSDDDD